MQYPRHQLLPLPGLASATGLCVGTYTSADEYINGFYAEAPDCKNNPTLECGNTLDSFAKSVLNDQCGKIDSTNLLQPEKLECIKKISSWNNALLHSLLNV